MLKKTLFLRHLTLKLYKIERKKTMATYTYKDKTYQFENSTKEEIENLANNFNTLRNSMVNIIETCLYDGLERIPDHTIH